MRKAAVDGCRLYAYLPQVLHLVLHQGDEWRDDNAQTVHAQRRHLECDALAASCRHESQRVATSTNALDDFTLNAAEIIVAPILFQDVQVISCRALAAVSRLCAFGNRHRCQRSMMGCQLTIGLRRSDILNLQLHLTTLEDIVLKCVGNVEGTLRLDVSS